MKKISLILLICTYALSTMGVGFKEFYCCGKLKSVVVEVAGNNKQSCTKEGCCKTKYQFLKLNDNHIAGADIHLTDKYYTALYFYKPVVSSASFAHQATRINRSYAPPMYDDDVPLYLSNNVFRI